MGLLKWLESKRPPFAVPSDASDPLVFAERTGGSVTLRNYRCPGLYVSLGRSSTQWQIVLTQNRLLIDGTGNKIRRMIDGAWTDPAVRALRPEIDDKNRVVIDLDASAFHADRTGQVTIRARCKDPASLVALITAHQQG
jgi:hypothetical protein